MRKLAIATICAVLLTSSACSWTDRGDAATPVPPRTSSASFLFAEPEGAALVEWTTNDGDVIGNITVASVNTVSMNVEQVATPIAGFVTPSGDVGLEYGKGDTAVNLTGNIDGDTLNLAGPFGLGDRTQLTFKAARPGEWGSAIAVLDGAVDDAHNAEIAAASAAAEAEPAANDEWVDPADPDVGDPYVDYEAENRRFDGEIFNIDTLADQAETAVADVEAAAAVEPMTSMQLTQVTGARTSVELIATDARSALARLEQHYTELRMVLLDVALETFTERLNSARVSIRTADRAVNQAEAIHDDAAARTRD